MDRQRRVFFIAVFILFTLVIVLDRLFFGWFIFKIENQTGWDSFRWYNFEYQFRNLESLRTQDKEKLILVVGSSIAQYSVQKDILEKDLKEISGTPFRVEILAHASMMPSDLSIYAKRIRGIKPYRVVYITNPADLDLERYLPPWEFGSEYRDQSHRDYLGLRFPMKIYYPGSFALENINRNSIETTISLLGRSLLYAVRYKNEWQEPLEFSLRSAGLPRKSYLYYQGREINEGIFAEGVTGKCFSFAKQEFNLDIEVRNPLLQAREFHIKFFARKIGRKTPGRYDAKVSEHYKNICRIKPEYRFISEFKPQRSGWQKIEMPPINDGDEYFAVLSHVENPDGSIVPGNDASYSGKGVRLPGNFGIQTNITNDIFVRRRGLEDIRISSLSEKDYIADFNRRIQPPDWKKKKYASIHQLNRLRLGKFYTNWAEFSEIHQIQRINQFIENLEGTPLIIINNPENPLTLDEYGDNAWYRGYLKYFHSYPARYKNVNFYDLSAGSSMINFIDSHHLTYDGILEMSPVYAKLILEKK